MMQNISSCCILLMLALPYTGCKEPKVSEMKVRSEMKKDSTHTIKYLTGKFIPEKHDLFIEVDTKYASRSGMLLRKEAFSSFVKMWEAAKQDSINLVIVSATRNFDYQKRIWEQKWDGSTTLSDGTKASDINDQKERALKILLYSSMPGTSRHHWGSDIDLNNFNNEWFETGVGHNIYSWLVANAPDYGFCQVYTEKGSGRPDGYEEEKWHWSYLPISKPLTNFAKEALSDDMISGFFGAAVALDIEVVNKYVLGIDPKCML